MLSKTAVRLASKEIDLKVPRYNDVQRTDFCSKNEDEWENRGMDLVTSDMPGANDDVAE